MGANNKISDDMLGEVNGGTGKAEAKYGRLVQTKVDARGGAQEESKAVSDKTRNSAAPKSDKKKKVTLR